MDFTNNVLNSFWFFVTAINSQFMLCIGNSARHSLSKTQCCREKDASQKDGGGQRVERISRKV
jgi:hypothetical protein